MEVIMKMINDASSRLKCQIACHICRLFSSDSWPTLGRRNDSPHHRPCRRQHQSDRGHNWCFAVVPKVEQPDTKGHHGPKHSHLCFVAEFQEMSEHDSNGKVASSHKPPDTQRVRVVSVECDPPLKLLVIDETLPHCFHDEQGRKDEDERYDEASISDAGEGECPACHNDVPCEIVDPGAQMPHIFDRGVDGSDEEVGVDKAPNAEEETWRGHSQVVGSVCFLVADDLPQDDRQCQAEGRDDANSEMSVRLGDVVFVTIKKGVLFCHQFVYFGFSTLLHLGCVLVSDQEFTTFIQKTPFVTLILTLHQSNEVNIILVLAFSNLLNLVCSLIFRVRPLVLIFLNISDL